jgi:hypothetical protein
VLVAGLALSFPLRRQKERIREREDSLREEETERWREGADGLLGVIVIISHLAWGSCWLRKSRVGRLKESSRVKQQRVSIFNSQATRGNGEGFFQYPSWNLIKMCGRWRNLCEGRVESRRGRRG